MLDSRAVLARSLLRHYPFQRGRARLARALLGKPDAIPAGMEVVTRYGTRIRVRPDGMYVSVFLFGDYEPSNMALFRRLIRPGDVVFDVGANFGWYTAVFARWVGEAGHVHAFEPVPSIRKLTVETIQLNRVERQVRLNPFGLSDEEGDFTVFTFAGLPHGHASGTDLGRPDATAHACSVRTLDEYVRSERIGRIDFMKIDVEGFEREVLLGGAAVLAGEHAPLVSFEINMDCLRARGLAPEDVRAPLLQAGYRHFWSIVPGGAERVTGALPAVNRDYLAARDDRRESLAGVLA